MEIQWNRVEFEYTSLQGHESWEQNRRVVRRRQRSKLSRTSTAPIKLEALLCSLREASTKKRRDLSPLRNEVSFFSPTEPTIMRRVCSSFSPTSQLPQKTRLVPEDCRNHRTYGCSSNRLHRRRRLVSTNEALGQRSPTLPSKKRHLLFENA